MAALVVIITAVVEPVIQELVAVHAFGVAALRAIGMCAAVMFLFVVFSSCRAARTNERFTRSS